MDHIEDVLPAIAVLAAGRGYKETEIEPGPFCPFCPSFAAKGGCFVAGTLVHTKEGLKPIEEIRVGDWVLSQPEMRGEQAYKRVTNTFQFEDKEIWEVCYLTPGLESEAIRATAEHPFWVQDIGWQGVEYLESYQLMLLHDGAPCLVGYVKRLDELAPVFNFEVEDFHTYYVGEWGVWVHNTGCAGKGAGLIFHLQLVTTVRLNDYPKRQIPKAAVRSFNQAIRSIDFSEQGG